MNTEYYVTGQDTGRDADVLRRAGAILREGGLVAFPTETVYGLGGSALDADAAKKIYAAKGRPSDNPLIVHVAAPADAEAFAFTNEVYYRLADAFMPGPLTVILPKRPCIPDSVTGGLDTVAVRCPSHPIAHRLIEAAGVPVAAPSANRSGRPSPTEARHVLADLGGRIPLIIDGGPCTIGVESTVVRLTAEGCEILRPGAVTARMLSDVIGKATVAPAVTDPAKAGDHPQSPGMKYKHYAPEAEVVMIEASAEDFREYVLSCYREGDAVAAADAESSAFAGVLTLSYGRTPSPQEEARRLFSLLREADECGFRRVFIRIPSENDEYLAVFNRLIRAAGGTVLRLTEKK